ncbi:MAG: di-heme oxidoredictase family protein [Planctomycetota bacterium]|nr:di-heme oxidoredictase family protein [Planctomycetota bacterium]
MLRLSPTGRAAVFATLFATIAATSGHAQTGRTLSLIQPAAVGSTMTAEVSVPATSNGLALGWWTIAEYAPTALPVPLPFNNAGLYRGGALLGMIPWNTMGPAPFVTQLNLNVPAMPTLAGFQFDVQTFDLTIDANNAWFASWSDNDLELTIAPGCAQAPTYNELYPAGTPQDPPLQIDTPTALITRVADRARLRHARDNSNEMGPFLPSNQNPTNPSGATVLSFNAGTQYERWKDNYWQQRTIHIEIEDRVAKGGTGVIFRTKTFARHKSDVTTPGAPGYLVPEWRFFYNRLSEPVNASTYLQNVGPAVIETSPSTGTVSSNPNATVGTEWTYEYQVNNLAAYAVSRPLQVGDEIEFEISQFMDTSPGVLPDPVTQLQVGTQKNYYGSTFLYVVGEGLRPWYAGEVETMTAGPNGKISYDSDAMPEAGRLGGDTTLHYTYSGETEWRYKQAAPNLAHESTFDFFNGRRLHHTGFDTGDHSEPNNAAILNPQTSLSHAGELGPNYTAKSCIACHVRNNRATLPPVGGELERFVLNVASDPTGATPHPVLGDTLSPKSINDPQEWQVEVEAGNVVGPQIVASTDPLDPSGQAVIFSAVGQYSLHGVFNLGHSAGSASYDLEVRYNSAQGAALKFEQAGGSPLYALLQLPPTTGWQTYSTTVSLPPSINLALAYDGASAGSVTVNWLRIGEQLPPGTPLSEGTVTLDAMQPYDDGHNQYADGTPYQLRKPVLAFSGVTPQYYSMRLAQPLVGLGLLEAVDESTILSFADPCDTDMDGVSGRAAVTTALGTGDARLGRFNWKGVASSIGDQIAYALNRDMGVTTSRFPTLDGDAQPSPVEVEDSELEQMVHYNGLLGVNARRDLHDPEALAGEALFVQHGCANCHVPQMTTGSTHPWAEVRNQTIRPFTDLLLHDMGQGLADNMATPASGASASEWRTTPLWGIGLSAGVGDGQEGYLHDGRAATLAEAILWHGGEGEAAKQAFRTSNAADRSRLIAFLRSL